MKEEEYNLCGQILLDNRIYHSLSVNEDHFLHVPKLFRAITKCIQLGITADILSICDIDPTLDKAFVAGCTNIGSVINWEWYQSKILYSWQLWQFDGLKNYLSDAVKARDKPSDILCNTEKIIMKIINNGEYTKIEKIGDIAQEYMKDLEERAKNKPGEILGISTHIRELDKITNGWKNRELIYIGGRPSDGKSAFMLNSAAHLVINENIPCGIMTLESSRKEIVKRLYISEGNIPSHKLALAQLTQSDINNLLDFSGTIYDKKLYVYDKANINIAQLRSVAKAMVTMYGIKALFIDYLQLIKGMDKKMSKTERIGENSIALKELARELNIPVICLAQLKRPEKKDDIPELEDFQWASQIEQDADICILIHHSEDGSWLLCKKVRDGALGNVPVQFMRDKIKYYPRTYHD